MLIILAVLVIFTRVQTLDFFKALFTAQPMTVQSPTIPPLVNIGAKASG